MVNPANGVGFPFKRFQIGFDRLCNIWHSHSLSPPLQTRDRYMLKTLLLPCAYRTEQLPSRPPLYRARIIRDGES